MSKNVSKKYIILALKISAEFLNISLYIFHITQTKLFQQIFIPQAAMSRYVIVWFCLCVCTTSNIKTIDFI